jgi:hypothetical protein
MATPNMGLDLPTTATAGPTYVDDNNTAFTTIDEHDHTTGNGVKVPTAGLNINADLSFNSVDATDLRTTRYDDQASTLSDSADKTCVYFVNGDLYINNASGTAVKITDGTGINLSSVGSIGGDYGQPGVNASASYSDTTKTFSWTQSSGVTAKMAVGDLILYENTSGANPVTILSPTSLGSPVSVTMPDATGTLGNVDTAETVSGAWTFSGNAVFTGTTSGKGIVPLGGIIAIGDNLTGTFTVPATGVVSEGWQLCDGAAVAGGQSVSGTTPDLSDERFLVGSTTSGTTGGANAITPTGTLSGTQSIAHTHTMDHNHQVAYWNYSATYASSNLIMNTTDSSTTGAFTTGQGLIGRTTTNLEGGGLTAMRPTEFSANKTLYSSGAKNAPNGTDYSSPSTGAMSANDTVSFSNGTFTGDSFNNRPLYVSCKYMVRVS